MNLHRPCAIKCRRDHVVISLDMRTFAYNMMCSQQNRVSPLHAFAAIATSSLPIFIRLMKYWHCYNACAPNGTSISSYYICFNNIISCLKFISYLMYFNICCAYKLNAHFQCRASLGSPRCAARVPQQIIQFCQVSTLMLIFFKLRVYL